MSAAAAAALAAEQKGDFAGAVTLYRALIAAHPTSWWLYSAVGNCYRAAGQLDQAIGAHMEAVALAGDRPEGWTNLGLAYQQARRYAEAQLCLERAAALAQHDPRMHHNLAGLHLQNGEPEAAERSARAALERDPNHAGALRNLALARKEQGDLPTAVELLRRLVARDEGDADAEFNLALALLAGSSEQEEEGWLRFEARCKLPHLAVAPTAARRRWRGEPIPGETLLLLAEQGLGDTFQFARYAKAARAVSGAARVVLAVQPALRSRFLSSDVADQVISLADEEPESALYAPLMSLPHLTGISVAESTRFMPNFSPGPNLEALLLHGDSNPSISGAHADRSDSAKPRRQGLRVGVVWQGNPSYRADARRSPGLRPFVPFVQQVIADGGTVFSLQKGYGSEQLAELFPAGAVVDLSGLDSGSGEAFVKTAEVIRTLDLVVASDTAVAHLAASLGRPVWLLLAREPDWRWRRTGATTDWYPTMRLFRQSRAGDWSGPVDEICARYGACTEEEKATGEEGAR